MNSRRLKQISAATGASAVVAMGALGFTLGTDDSATTVVSDPAQMTLGETSTIEKAATEVETSVAVPEVTAEPPDGFGP
jgi:hypothetical protein